MGNPLEKVVQKWVVSGTLFICGTFNIHYIRWVFHLGVIIALSVPYATYLVQCTYFTRFPKEKPNPKPQKKALF